jgi:Leucine-rich repeat (LRR) protein
MYPCAELTAIKESLPWRKATELNLDGMILTRASVPLLSCFQHVTLWTDEFDEDFVFPCKKLTIDNGCRGFNDHNPLTFYYLTVLEIHWGDDLDDDGEWKMPDLPNLEELTLSGEQMTIILPKKAPKLQKLHISELSGMVRVPSYPLLTYLHFDWIKINLNMHQPSLRYLYWSASNPLSLQALNAPLLKELHVVNSRKQNYSLDFSNVRFQLDTLYIEGATVSGRQALQNTACHFKSCT